MLPFRSLLPARFSSQILLAACVALVGAGPSLSQAGKCPNIQIIMDRSGSMSEVLDTSTRWDVAKNVLKAQLTPIDTLARFGITIFPNLACDSDTAVHPAYSMASAIGTALDAMDPGGATPSGTAVRDVAGLSELQDSTRPQYTILITDGGPGCGGEPDSTAGTVGEIQKAFMQTPSIVTFVVGVGNLAATEIDALNQMADAGGRARAGTTHYFPASSTTEINSSLTNILSAIALEVGVCSDATPDMGTATDMATPRDMASGLDMAARDMAASSDMARSGDMAMSMDMARSGDMAMSMADMRQSTKDLASGPGDDGGDNGSSQLIVYWIDPNQMVVGTGVQAQINGRGFISSVPSSRVYFDSGGNLVEAGSVLVIDGYRIQLFVPKDLPIGTYDVVVKNPDGQSARVTQGFIVTPLNSGCSCSLGAASTKDSRLPFGPPAAIFVILLATFMRRRRRTA